MIFSGETFSAEVIFAIELALRIGIVVLALGSVCVVVWSIVSKIKKTRGNGPRERTIENENGGQTAGNGEQGGGA